MDRLAPYMGKILWVNLSAKTWQEEPLPEALYRQYLGGSGLAAYILYRDIPAHADTLGPGNILGFVPGLLTGTPAPFTGRWMVVGKSPLTGTWGEANCGGYLSPAIKKCGYDGIFFTGINPSPTYVEITSGGVSFHDAAKLWGMDAIETEKALKDIHSSKKRPAIACIGPAGEALSLISGIVHDNGRIAARSGLGAVMGSKKLKAIVLNGDSKVNFNNPDRIREIAKGIRKLSHINFRLPGSIMPLFGKILRNRLFKIRLDGILINYVLHKWGSSGMYQALVEWNDAPIKNWSGSHLDFPTTRSKSASPRVIAQAEQRKYHCYSCPTGCGGIFQMPGSQQETHKPEYETLNAFGALILNDNYVDIIKINDLLNRAGIDSISAGATVAAAIEWAQSGLLSKEQTCGIDLSWGDSHAVLLLVQQMAENRGFGAVLLDGIRSAEAKLGIKASQASLHAGGQELAMHDFRLDAGYALHASVEPSPGKHTSGSLLNYDLYRLWTFIARLPKTPLISIKKRGEDTCRIEGIKGVVNSCFTNFYTAIGFCYYGAFLGADRLQLFEQVNAACNWEFSPEAYLQIGQRIQTLKQLFNLKHGIEPASIKPTLRALGHPPLVKGGNKNISIDLEKLRFHYWDVIGFDPASGIPKIETINTLGLSAAAEEINLPALILEPPLPLHKEPLDRTAERSTKPG